MKFLRVTTEMKSYWAVISCGIVYIVLCCTRWFWLSSLWMKSCGMTIQMKATEQYFPVVLLITLYKFVQAELFCGAFISLYKEVQSNSWVFG